MCYIYLLHYIYAPLGRFRALCERALLHHSRTPRQGSMGHVSPPYPQQLNPLPNPARGQGRRRRGRSRFKSHHRTQGFCLLSNQEALLISVVCNSS